MDDGTNYTRVLERVRRLLREGSIRPSAHAQKRMAERGFDMNDLQNIIRTGRIVGHTCPNDKWTWKIAGMAVDGDRAACVGAIEGYIVVITVMAD